MKCEGDCGRSFRNGETVYAIPTRIVIVRNGRETFNIVDRVLCAPCYVSATPHGTDALHTRAAAVRG
jgi:hypothetical protein